MPNVQMPDGTVVAFPDEMPEAQINAELAKWHASSQGSGAEASPAGATPQDNSWARLPKMAASALAKGAIAAGGIPGDVQSGIEGLATSVFGPGRSTEGLSPTLTQRLPTSGELLEASHRAGLTDRNDLTPQGPMERYGSAALEALPAVAGVVASGGAALPALATGEASAMASQGAHDLAPESKWAPVVAGLGAGLGMGGLTKSVENWLSGRAAKALATDTETQAAAAQAKLQQAKEDGFQGKTGLANSVTDLRQASKEDFAATRDNLDQERDLVHGQADQGISAIANGLAPSTTLQQAGTALQAKAQSWLTSTLPGKLAEAWKPVDEAIPKDAPVTLGAFQGALKDINSSAGSLEPVATLLKPGAPKALGKALAGVADAAELQGKTPGQFTWGDVQKLRTTLGDAMSNPSVIKDVGQQNMSKLYATLTADMKSAAHSAGAGDLFDQANAESSRLYGIGEGPIARVLGAPDAALAPETAAKRLLTGGKAGASDLATLRQEIPEGVDHLAAAHLATDASGWQKMAPETQAALLPDPAKAQFVTGALQAKDQASAAAKAGKTLAQQQHQTNLDALARAQTEGNFAYASAVRSSSKDYMEAKAAAAQAAGAVAKTQGPTLGGHASQGLFGTALGNELGVLGMHALGLPGSDLVHSAVGGTIGGLAPMIVRGGISTIKNPSRLVYPALGAGTGVNQLQPSSSR